MKLVRVTPTNLAVYLNLAQSYEGEFSAITGKEPDAQGRFALDTQIGGPVSGFILYVGETPAGIVAVADKGAQRYEVCEFYVVPCFRARSWGRKFAHALWEMLPGSWEIKQISGAEYASAFWRKTIASFHGSSFEEERYDDPYWGLVTRQRFTASPVKTPRIQTPAPAL